jgi:hypothetical protein
MLPVVLYGRETYVTLSEVHRLRVYQKTVLRGKFGIKREEVEGGWEKFQYEEFHNLLTLHQI